MGKLTARGCESRAKKKGRFGDGEGLFLRVLDPGKRVYWVYRYRVAKHEREMSLGPYPEITLEQARIKHVDARATVLKGTDPLAGRRGAKIALPSGKPTFGQCADAYIRSHEAG